MAGREEVVSHRKKITEKIKLAAALLVSTSLIHRRALAGLCGGDPAEIAPEGWQATAGSPGCVGARGGPGGKGRARYVGSRPPGGETGINPACGMIAPP